MAGHHLSVSPIQVARLRDAAIDFLAAPRRLAGDSLKNTRPHQALDYDMPARMVLFEADGHLGGRHKC